MIVFSCAGFVNTTIYGVFIFIFCWPQKLLKILIYGKNVFLYELRKSPFFYACSYDMNASLLILCYIELESWLTYISHSLSKYLKINMVLLATIPKSKNNSPSNPILPYFKIDEQNIKYVNCTICNAKLSRLVKPNQPTFLYYHLIMFHPEIYISDK